MSTVKLRLYTSEKDKFINIKYLHDNLLQELCKLLTFHFINKGSSNRMTTSEPHQYNDQQVLKTTMPQLFQERITDVNVIIHRCHQTM